MLYISWLNPIEIFNPILHHSSKNILSVKVSHQEGALPYVHLLLVNDGLANHRMGEKAVIYYKRDHSPKILFCGSMVKNPVQDNPYRVRITLTPDTEHSKILLAQQALKVLPQFDGLFVAPDSGEDLDEILEGYINLPHWNREGAFSFSGLFEGSKTIHLDDRFDDNSLKTRIKKRALGDVSVHLSVQWVQEYTGLVNLSPALMEALPEPFITTLTPQAVQKSWLQPGHVIHHTGYTVMQSSLIPFDPVTGGTDYRYPAISAGFSIKDRAGAHLPRSWFVPHLVMGMIYRQKREESVCFTLQSSLQPLFLEHQDSRQTQKKLRFKLQDIRLDHETPFWTPSRHYAVDEPIQHHGRSYVCSVPHQSSSTFEEDWDCWRTSSLDRSPLGDGVASTYFLTPRGNQSILHALERARAYLAMGARVFETTFETDFHFVEDIDCDTSIRLKDERFQGGELVGKVVAYTLTFLHGVARARITLLSSIGQPITFEPLEDHGQFLETPSGIIIENPRDQKPEEGIIDPRQLDGFAVLRRLRVKNSAEEQNALLAGKTFSSLKEAEALVKQHPTHLTVDLMDLNRGDVAHHAIMLKVIRPWIPPCQVHMIEEEC